MLASEGRFDRWHQCEKLIVVGGAVNAGVDASMAIGAQTNNEPRVVRSSVANSANVVRLKVMTAVGTQEWRLSRAAFAMSLRSMQNVTLHVGAALVDISRCALPWCPDAGRLICTIAQVNRIDWLALFSFDSNVLYLLADRIQEAQLEDDSVTHLSFRVRSPLNAVVLVDHFTFKSERTAFVLEKQKATTLSGMVTDGAVALDHPHVAFLAFAIVFENSILSQDVGIAVSQAGFAADDEVHCVGGRRDDPSALLAIKSSMNVRPSVVDAANLKSPSHPFPQVFRPHANRDARDSKAWRAAA